MHRLIVIGTEALMDILGLEENTRVVILTFFPSNPRRNTSRKESESSRSGDKADTYFHFVSALYPLSPEIREEVDTEWRQGGYMSPLSNYLSSINR
jgi:hypothetical protein